MIEDDPRCSACVEPLPLCCGQVHPEFCGFDRATISVKSAYWCNLRGLPAPDLDLVEAEPQHEPPAARPSCKPCKHANSPANLARVRRDRAAGLWVIDEADESRTAPSVILSGVAFRSAAEGGEVVGWAEGVISSLSDDGPGWRRVRYTQGVGHPFLDPDGSPVHAVSLARFDADGSAWSA